MPATYSVNIGTEYEASRLPDILSVLKNIPDNTHKLISPRDVRDAFLSTWANSAIKQTTTTTGTEYIGIDSGNPANRDIKQKIFLGKRQFGGSDILNNSLLTNPNNDIYIFNTKIDTATQSNTRIAILAGTTSSLYSQAPYIESRSDGSKFDFEFRNPSINNGSINIYSSSGRVSINGIIFPSVSESSASASNGKVLRYYGTYPNGSLRWDNTNVNTATIGSPGSPLNIYGSTVSLNGYSLEFINNTIVPSKVGGIPIGTSFSSNTFYNGSGYQNWPIVEVLRNLLFPYVPPHITLEAINATNSISFAEVGTTASVDLKYKIAIYPRSNSEYVSDYYIISNEPTIGEIQYTKAPPYSGLSFSTQLPGTTFSGTVSLTKFRNSYGTVSFSFKASDSGVTSSSYPSVPSGINPFGFSHSATASFTYIYPIIYGFTNSVINDNSSNFTAGVNTISKLVKPYPGLSNSISFASKGDGYFYFCFPSAYFGSVSQIKDPNGFILYNGILSGSFFTFSTGVSNANYAIPTNYTIWRTVGTCSYNQNGLFEFKF
jgi:hypothetical protein